VQKLAPRRRGSEESRACSVHERAENFPRHQRNHGAPAPQSPARASCPRKPRRNTQCYFVSAGGGGAWVGCNGHERRVARRAAPYDAAETRSFVLMRRSTHSCLATRGCSAAVQFYHGPTRHRGGRGCTGDPSQAVYARKRACIFDARARAPIKAVLLMQERLPWRRPLDGGRKIDSGARALLPAVSRSLTGRGNTS